MTALTVLFFIGMCAEAVIIAALFGGCFVILRREADLVVQLDRLEAEANSNQDHANDLARRLTRRRNPIVPAQRSAS